MLVQTPMGPSSSSHWSPRPGLTISTQCLVALSEAWRWIQTLPSPVSSNCYFFQVVNTIGNAKTHPKSDKPYDDISMVSISVRNPMV